MQSTAPERLAVVDEGLQVEKLAPGGEGFGRRANGEPVFVPGGLPGDEVTLRQLRVERGYSRATEWTLARPSSDRRTPPCPYQTRCGGCDLMPLRDEAQRRAKHALVLEALRRTGGLDLERVRPGGVQLRWHDAAEASLSYRSRIRVHIGEDGKLGFLARQTHELVAIEQCLAAAPRINSVLTRLHELTDRAPQLLLPFKAVEIRALGEHPDLTWFVRDEQRDRRSSAVARTAEHRALERVKQALDDERLAMTVHPVSSSDLTPLTQSVPLAQEPGSPRLWFTPGVFTQVHWTVNQALIQHLVARVRGTQMRTFADLYCGAGNFSLPLLAAGLRGCGVEANPAGISLLRAASQAQSLGGSFSAEPVHVATTRWVRQKRKFDLLVVDPPRAGFKEATAAIAQLATRAIFLCACDPVTFARDLRTLLEHGFQLVELVAFDMFPQTHHMELTAWLEPRGCADSKVE